MEREEDDDEERRAETNSPSLFPLFAAAGSSTIPPPPPALPQATSFDPQWLRNASFTAEVTDLHPPGVPLEFRAGSDEEFAAADEAPSVKVPSYDLVVSSPNSNDDDHCRKHRDKRRKKRKRRKERDGSDDDKSRRSGVRAWEGSETKPDKDYYVDVRGDRDNLAFGSLYRMDVARYKHHGPTELSRSKLQILHRWNNGKSLVDVDSDLDVLDSKLRIGGRYCSTKYSSLERHKGLKHVKVVSRKVPTYLGEFVPLLELPTSPENNSSLSSGKGGAEESWEDEVLRKTRDFNRMSREFPHNEKIWIAFSEFQDKIASMQPQKAARLQTLEKKISILEKAVELNPESEELLLYLLKSYERRDSSEVFMGRWEKVLRQHFGSYKLWKEFLLVGQGEFSRFKVSDMRKRYSHAIQALFSASSRLCRQASLGAKSQQNNSDIIQLELGLVDIFLSLCRFEWQAGFQELATGLFQAEIEYSLFRPSLDLSLQSKQRLFEHFWNSGVARCGEDDAFGWSVWIEKEEEHRQSIIKDESVQETEVGGWSGWYDPLSRSNENDKEHENKGEGDGNSEGLEVEDAQQEDDIEALLKKLGINVDAEPHSKVKDAMTWNRWSKEESLRDCEQWIPVRQNSDKDDSEQLLRAILFEDVCDYLFSLSSEEARFCLVSRFIDFFGGEISQWACTNSSRWIENNLSLDAVPGSILQYLNDANELIKGGQSCQSHLGVEVLMSSSNDMERRTDIIKFLRNSLLLCLNIFPRNYILEEALLVAEEQLMSQISSSTSSVIPSQALAKRLLKNDRQDVLLSGLYARRESVHGNLDRARKIFDMALSLIGDLPSDLKETIPLLYFWYAEMEVENDTDEQFSSRAIHILSFLGSGEDYTPFNGQVLSMRILKARNGFKEQIKCLRSAWGRGCITDQSVALTCAASLFEILTTGWVAGIEVIEETFSMVLPEQRSQSLQLETLCIYYMKLLKKYMKEIKLPRVWSKILQGFQTYPYNPKVISSLIEVGRLYTVPQKIRCIFDENSQSKPSVIMLLFALSYELGRSCSQHRIRGLFERALADDKLQRSVILWRCYLAFEVNFASNHSAAKRIFFRAIHACPWSKKLWLDGFQKLNSILIANELSDLHEVMRDKELHLRTDIYEILLQDEFDN